MQQEAIDIKYKTVILPPFTDQNVAASQSDAQLPVAVDHDGVLMPADGWVVGMSIQLNAAATAGSLTVGISVDGTEVTTTTRTIATATEDYITWRPGIDAPSFVAGELVGVEITTDGDWDGTTADLMVTVFVTLDDLN